MLTSVARVLHSTHRKWRVNNEMEGWMIRGNLAPSSSDGDDDEDDESGDEAVASSTQEQCAGVPVVFMLIPQKKRLSSVKKTTLVVKKAITEKSEKWKSREWYGTTKTMWQQPAGSGGETTLSTPWSM